MNASEQATIRAVVRGFKTRIIAQQLDRKSDKGWVEAHDKFIQALSNLEQGLIDTIKSANPNEIRK